MPHRHKKVAIHAVPLLIILGGFFAFFFFHLNRYLGFQSLQAHHVLLIAWTEAHPVLAMCVFISCYILTILCAVPSTLLFSLTAGFLFGVADGFVAAMVSAVTGAALFFMMVKSALADWLAKKMSQRLRQFEKGFQANAFNYILMLRLIPVFPFFIVNIASALLNARLSAFVVATLLGIIPNTLVYVSLGHGMEKVFEQHQTPNLGVIFQPHLLVPLLCLAMMAILPVVYKRLRRRRATAQTVVR